MRPQESFDAKTVWLAGWLGDRQICRAFNGQISAVIQAEQNLHRALQSLAFPVDGKKKYAGGLTSVLFQQSLHGVWREDTSFKVD